MGAVVLRPDRMQRALVVRRSAGCGLVLLLLFGLAPSVSAAAALPRSLLPDAGYLRSWPIAACAAMPILHCARDRVTCAARARQRGTSGFGWRAAVGQERGIAVWDRAQCGASVVERGLSGSVGTLRGCCSSLHSVVMCGPCSSTR